MNPGLETDSDMGRSGLRLGTFASCSDDPNITFGSFPPGDQSSANTEDVVISFGSFGEAMTLSNQHPGPRDLKGAPTRAARADPL